MNKSYIRVKLTAVLLMLPVWALAADDQTRFNTPGNIVIADQFNNQVIEVDPSTHATIWNFGDGSFTPGPQSIVGPNDAERVGSFTLISGTGIPPMTPPCPDLTNGCPDNRVILVDRRKRILWQYGKAGVAGSGFDRLNTPVCAVLLPNSHVLITDQGNARIIEVTFAKQIVWKYEIGLNNPNSAELLANGNILIADENNNRVIEVNRNKQIVQTFTAGGTISGAAFASRLPNGNTLITDSNHSRIVEVGPDDNVVFQYFTNTDVNSNPAPLPTRAVRLQNGNTLISDQFNDRVIEINASKQIVFTQGVENVPGKGTNLLNAPYDAKVVGDYTGLTPPPDIN